MRIFVALVAIAACKQPAQTTLDGATQPDGEQPSNDGSIDSSVDAPNVSPDASPDAAIPPTLNRTKLSVGNWQSCQIRGDGSLWCWGTRDRSVPNSSKVPARVGTSTQWTTISLNWHQACGIDGGALYCWGLNATAVLGTGDTNPRPDPTQIGTTTDWTAVAVGGGHACGLRGGALYCWGSNTRGEAGTGTNTVVMTPTQLGTATDWVAIAAGEQNTCGLRGTGFANTLWCWGDGDNGALGNGSQTSIATPTQVGTASDWIAITAYSSTGCGRRSDGTAWCWGRGFTMTPSLVGTTNDYTAMVGTTTLSCGVHGGTLSCKGSIHHVGAGDGTQVPRSSFVDIGAGRTWTTVAASGTHACGADDTGGVWCWGSNGYGGLGLGTRSQHETYDQVGTATNWTSVTMDSFYDLTCGLAGDSAYCWGGPGAHQGNDTGYANQVPTLVGTGYVKVTSGLGVACGIKTDGTLWCWGDGRSFGFTTAKSTPTQIGTATDWTTVSVDRNTCGIRGGALYCWGNNFNGAVGDGTTTFRATPVQIGTATDWTTVATQQGDTCGIRGGALYCWGYRVNSTTPEQQGTDTDWKTINVDYSGYECGIKGVSTWACQINGSIYIQPGADWAEVGDQCGVKLDGTLWCNNSQVGTDTDWAKFFENNIDACGIRKSGKLTCLGDGLSGQLGLGDAWTAAPTAVAQ